MLLSHWALIRTHWHYKCVHGLSPNSWYGKYARKAYEQSIEINPNQNDCLYNLANLIVDDDPHSALDYPPLKIQPMMASAQHNLGKLYLDLDCLDSAFKCLNKSLQL